MMIASVLDRNAMAVAAASNAACRRATIPATTPCNPHSQPGAALGKTKVRSARHIPGRREMPILPSVAQSADCRNYPHPLRPLRWFARFAIRSGE